MGNENMDRAKNLLKQVTLIICTVDRFADLERCLASVEPSRPALSEIIVVNNGPHFATINEIARRHGARVISVRRRGVARARNAGIRAAQSAFVAFMDDDTAALENWLERLVAPFADSTIDCILGAVRPENPADSLQQEFERLSCPPLPAEAVVLEAASADGHFPLRLAMKGVTMNVAFRREVFEKFGYFDKRFGRGTRIRSGEDTDLFFNILRRGGKILIEPRAIVAHRWPSEPQSLRRSTFAAACGHTAILMKYFVSESKLRGEIVRYVAARWRSQRPRDAQNTSHTQPPRLPFLLGSLWGPMAFLLSRIGEGAIKQTSDVYEN